MSWIREEDDGLPPIPRALSINPGAQAAIGSLVPAIIRGSSALTEVQEEAIAAVVSVANECHY